MKGKLSLHYDEGSDYLEIFAGTPSPNHGEEIPDKRGVTIFKDNKTNEVVGIGILGFKKRSVDFNEIELELPIDINLSAVEIE
ncbi:hypothetical protein CMI38_07140 [Candidatus Pacearchaeota archaeon]|jgi:hypothetical protein|nr:hypothetical protein [Candidatus Pacearchaeota archaeon]|tara:strand:- start:5176 stop:5424 length:249 start_codon:yes stop_codon:yes gene_type:complete